MMPVLRLLFTLTFLAMPLVAQESYEVRMHRPVKKGERFKLDAKVAVDVYTKTILNADDIEETKVLAACKLTGDLTILDITAKGLAKELRLKLTTAECIADGEAADFFKKGDVIYLRHGEPDSVVQVNGQEPDSEQGELIDTFLYVQGDENSTDDELLGTSSKVKPGDSWAMNKEAMLKDWIREGFEGLKAEDIKGKTTLTEITKLEGEPAVRLNGEFTIENTGLQMPSFPEEIRAKKFKLTINDETDLPIDPTRTAARSRMSMTIESDSDGTIEQDGRATKVRVNMRQRCAAEVHVVPQKGE
jgi:hypothetical protein